MKIFGIILGALGLYVCVMNYISIGVSLYNKKHGIDRFVSSVPLIAGIMMFISAVILLPKNIWALGFFAFLLDHTYPMLVYSVIVTRFFTRDPNEKK
ncbi:MAG: hypothetical protein HDT43_11035 [Ruminococcaceae bacterium]|nr:hypothetical protein [Oscillospiraceae bacterium]